MRNFLNRLLALVLVSCLLIDQASASSLDFQNNTLSTKSTAFVHPLPRLNEDALSATAAFFIRSLEALGIGWKIRRLEPKPLGIAQQSWSLPFYEAWKKYVEMKGHQPLPNEEAAHESSLNKIWQEIVHEGGTIIPLRETEYYFAEAIIKVFAGGIIPTATLTVENIIDYVLEARHEVMVADHTRGAYVMQEDGSLVKRSLVKHELDQLKEEIQGWLNSAKTNEGESLRTYLIRMPESGIGEALKKETQFIDLMAQITTSHRNYNLNILNREPGTVGKALAVGESDPSAASFIKARFRSAMANDQVRYVVRHDHVKTYQLIKDDE